MGTWTEGVEGGVLGVVSPAGCVEVAGVPARVVVAVAEEACAAPCWVWLVRAVLARVAPADPPDVGEIDAPCPSCRLALAAGAAVTACLTALGRALMVVGPRWVGAVWPGSSKPTAAPPPTTTTAAIVATVAGMAPTDAPGWANCAALRVDRSRPEAPLAE
jgi:hypothetical protein